MKALPTLQMTGFLLCGAGLGFMLLPAARAAEGAEGITAVSSTVSRDYVRIRLPDGSFQPEGYTFGRGGHYQGPINDDTIDRLGFENIANDIAGPLAGQNYLPSLDPNRTKLLIMLYWGTTYVGEASEGGLDNDQRNFIDYRNAQMLGYNSGEGLVGTDWGAMLDMTALRWRSHDLVFDVESPRYFVVLMAYDFRLMWKQKKHKLLWDARFSLYQAGNDFGKALPSMAQYASRYFGQDSKGLVRKMIPLGNVEVGQPTLIELDTGK
jgi:hypothetical protein